jgi:exonuclease III
VRLVCWNACRGTDRKWPVLEELRPDVAVLSEVARVPRAVAPSLFEPAVDWHWVGANPGKGLAVATFGRPSVPLPAEAGGRWSVAARVGRLVVVGIWSCPSGGGGAAAYGREVLRGLDAHARWLADPATPVVVAGDFNVDGRSNGFALLDRRLRDLGLHSVYHRYFGEPMGAEVQATYFHQRDRMRPFHIDFCFVSADLAERIELVEVGGYDDWVATGHSDHVPLIVEWSSAG